MSDKLEQSRWAEYIEKTKEMPPRPLLVEAVAFVSMKNEALDLGAGALQDTKYLLSQGFKHVTALDKENLVEDILKELPQDRVEYVVSNFENFEFPLNKFDLINAEYSLPFNPSSTSETVLIRIKNSLKPGGIFAGQLFGLNDTWNTEGRDMTFYSREQVERLFNDMEIIKLSEEEKDGQTVVGGVKHWHIFHIIARKKD